MSPPRWHWAGGAGARRGGVEGHAGTAAGERWARFAARRRVLSVQFAFAVLFEPGLR